MTTYQLTEENYVIKDGVTVIPSNPFPDTGEYHPEYSKYLDWVAAGNIPLPAKVIIQVPEEVTRSQGKAALILSGLWELAEQYIESIEDPIKASLARVALNDTVTWKRNSEFLTEVTQALNLSTEQVDQLFITAAGIQL